MTKKFDPVHNYRETQKKVGYVARQEADEKTYFDLGFKCGLEIHQQLKTAKKLFCRCPGGIYHGFDDFDAEVIRHMRPTLSELGEYDGTALMEFKTRKNITYRLNNKTACTYEIDDTPPFPLNLEALDIAIENALLLKANIVGELHITRKQYLDGSIPTGFQRTAIVGIEGEIPLKSKKIRIIQISIEEDSCREVSDIGHERIYTTDRLGMPLIETVTYPDMLTPDEAAEAGHYLRFLCRGTGKVRTGIGAAREDVNVSITGGTRVEIKGVAHIKWIPELTHNEAFRQNALLQIKDILGKRIPHPEKWSISHTGISPTLIPKVLALVDKKQARNYRWTAVNLPQFKGILSYFTQPGKSFSNELCDRLKVIACIEKPNMVHSEAWNNSEEIGPVPGDSLHQIVNKVAIDFSNIQKRLKSGENDAQLIFWGPEADVATALETIEERCRLAFVGVPNETRKSFPNGATIFERVLPGPDRMYPDTDSAPIPIEEETIRTIRDQLPTKVSSNTKQMAKWRIPEDTYAYILKRNLFPLLKRIITELNQPPRLTGTILGHDLKHLEGRIVPAAPFDYNRLFDLFDFVLRKKLRRDILKVMLPVVFQYPNMDFESVLTTIGYRPVTEEEILENIPILKEKFLEISKHKDPAAMVLWVMGTLRPLALGNMPLKELQVKIVETDGNEDGNGGQHE
jgi:glutamyl-tRNA(Gln) amidotransferase subunit E